MYLEVTGPDSISHSVLTGQEVQTGIQGGWVGQQVHHGVDTVDDTDDMGLELGTVAVVNIDALEQANSLWYLDQETEKERSNSPNIDNAYVHLKLLVHCEIGMLS